MFDIPENFNELINEAIAAMEEEEADTVLVVRCRNCIYSSEFVVRGGLFCNVYDRCVYKDGFCHKGEHR